MVILRTVLEAEIIEGNDLLSLPNCSSLGFKNESFKRDLRLEKDIFLKFCMSPNLFVQKIEMKLSASFYFLKILPETRFRKMPPAHQGRFFYEFNEG